MTPIEVFKQKFDKMVDNISASIDNGAGYVIDEVYKILDSLNNTELPEDLEEAAYNFALHYDNGTCDGIAQDCFIAGAEWMKAKMCWHSVEESLPEIDEEVIVLKDNLGTAPIYEIAMAHIVDRNHCSDYNGWNIPGVKFWMPMPKIPENK